MNTEFISKAAQKHKGKVIVGGGTGLSAAAVVFLLQWFVTQAEFRKHVEDCDSKRSKQWQKLMDHELEIDRLKRVTGSLDLTNSSGVALYP